MRSNYKQLGEYIREVDDRNTKMQVNTLLGVSIEKKFIPSIANIIGTDMSTYKIVKRNHFAYGPVTSRNGDKISIALQDQYDEAIVSQAYIPFEITDPKRLNPEYLMMWFRRPEFDRFARFKSHGSAREIFDWEEMCKVELPVPHPDKQRELVKEYNTIVNRINLNNKLIQKLEETAQAIYKQWFVDFEFPDENGQPYKSNGGEMEWCEELGREVPKGWEAGKLSNLVDIIDGDRGNNYPSIQDFFKSGYCLFLNAGNVTKTGFDFSDIKFITKEKDKILRKGKIKENDIVVTTRGTVGNIGFYSETIPYKEMRINSGMVILRAKSVKESSIFAYSLLRNSEIKYQIETFVSGSAQPQLPIRDLEKIPILLPCTNNIIDFSGFSIRLQKIIDNKKNELIFLNKLQELLLSKLVNLQN